MSDTLKTPGKGTITVTGGEPKIGSESPYVTFNPSDVGATITLSNENRSAIGSSRNLARTNFGRTAGKWYFEVVLGGRDVGVGLCESIHSLTPANLLGSASGTSQTNAWAIQMPNSGTNVFRAHAGTVISSDSFSSFSAADILSVAVDFDTNKVWFAYNNTYVGSGNPGTGTNAAYSDIVGVLFPAITVSNTASVGPSIIKARTRDLTYSPPSGFLPWDDGPGYILVQGFLPVVDREKVALPGIGTIVNTGRAPVVVVVNPVRSPAQATVIVTGLTPTSTVVDHAPPIEVLGMVPTILRGTVLVPHVGSISSLKDDVNWATNVRGGIPTASNAFSSGPGLAFDKSWINDGPAGSSYYDSFENHTYKEVVGNDAVVTFSGSRSIGRVTVWFETTAFGTYVPNHTDPGPSDTSSSTFRPTNFTIETWNGSSWDIRATVTFNTLSTRSFTFGPVSTTKVRISVTSTSSGVWMLREFEAFEAQPTIPPTVVVTDLTIGNIVVSGLTPSLVITDNLLIVPTNGSIVIAGLATHIPLVISPDHGSIQVSGKATAVEISNRIYTPSNATIVSNTFIPSRAVEVYGSRFPFTPSDFRQWLSRDN